MALLCCFFCFACNPFAIPAAQPQNQSKVPDETVLPHSTQPFFSLPLLEGKLKPAPTELPLPAYTSTQTLTPTRTPTATFPPTVTFTATLTPTPTPTIMPKLNVLFQTCDTGLDILAGLGEITNAYVTIQNIGNQDAENVRITLAASDEEKPHRDHQYFVPHLPSQHEISVKLTADTSSRQDTVLTVHVSADNAASESVTKGYCSSRYPDRERIEALGALFKVVPIAVVHK